MPRVPRLPLLVAAHVVPCLAVVPIGAPARAQSSVTGAADVTVGGGYDSNPLLAVPPGADPSSPPEGGAFGRVAPSLVGGLAFGGGHRLELGYTGDLRSGEEFGRVTFHEGGLGYSAPRLGSWKLKSSVRAGAFDVSSLPSDRFWFVGGDLGARVELGEQWRWLVDATLESRSFPDDPLGARTDALHVFDTRLSFRPSPLVDLGLRALALASAAGPGRLFEDASFWRVRGGPTALGVWGRLTVTAQTWAGGIDVFGAGARPQLGGSLVARVAVLSVLDVVMGLDIARGLGTSARTVDDRELAFLGVALRGSARRALSSASEAVAARDEDPDAVAPVARGGRVRFRVRDVRATDVRVVGSWDGWSTPGAALRPVAVEKGRAPGLFEAWVPLAPGVHRYRFVVDGEARRPEGAPRYERDDFGGEDGVVEVGPEDASRAGRIHRGSRSLYGRG